MQLPIDRPHQRLLVPIGVVHVERAGNGRVLPSPTNRSSRPRRTLTRSRWWLGRLCRCRLEVRNLFSSVQVGGAHPAADSFRHHPLRWRGFTRKRSCLTKKYPITLLWSACPQILEKMITRKGTEITDYTTIIATH